MHNPPAEFTFQNWDRSVVCKPRHYVQPSTEAEVVEIAGQVARAGARSGQSAPGIPGRRWLRRMIRCSTSITWTA